MTAFEASIKLTRIPNVAHDRTRKSLDKSLKYG